MRTTSLLKRGLTYYWQTNLVVVLGVATAVAVLAGALLIGASVRGSLLDLVSQRLGNTDHIVSSPGFFREQLANDLAACPVIALDGVVTHEPSKRRAGDVRVYGVDERFWQFNGLAKIDLENRQALLSDGLASELGTQPGDSLLLRIEKPSDIPIESLHGRKDDPGKTIRLNVSRSLPRESLGEFSLRPTQGVVRAVFVPLRFLQRELDQEAKINTILVNAPLNQTEALLRDKATLEDLGLKLRTLDNGDLSLESNSNLIGDNVAAAADESARALALSTLPVLSYLANNISAGDRSIPYSLVAALDDEETSTASSNSIVLNEWAARELNVQTGQTISLEYYVWHEGGRLETRKADFQLAGVVKIGGLAADRDLVPEYPGITESESLSDWDPPFPVDLSRVRQRDEDYWDQYRTTPKAFISLADGQKLWQSRFGKLTSIRVHSPDGSVSPEVVNNFQEQLRKALPTSTALQVVPVRAQGMSASRGATDFGEYFLYFSFFLVVSALLLTALFFKLGIEQRLREIGTLQAVGFAASRIRNLFLAEGLLLAIIGSLIGLLGAIGYAGLLMYGLRTWWVDAVGTTSLTLHITWQSLVLGAAGGIAAAVACIFLTLRKVGRSSTRSLITGTTDDTSTVRRGKSYVFVVAITTALTGVALLVAGGFNLIPQVAGFFGGGVLLLVAGVCFLSVWLRSGHRPIQRSGWWAMSQLGFRNTTYRPARTVLCVTLIASAAFIIVAVDAFRRSGAVAHDRKSGSGGFPIVAESLLPIVHDANTVEGREALNLNNTNENLLLKDVRLVNLRMRPGDDASCLNLYQPRNPKIIAPPDDFIAENRFAFNNSLEETENPWSLLNKEFPDGAIPVIGDANSLSYVLHLKVGEDFILDHGPTPVKLRVVAALADSIFQSELIMSDKNFVRLFPSEQGYRYFLIDAPNESEAATVLEDRLSDFGFDAQSTEERLASFHRVENTYLSTFQLLGGLGLALGTLGMAAVLLRNVLERRRELALMRAVGYNSSHFAVMVITENVLMLCLGLAVGFVCALLSIAPVLFERGGQAPNISLGLLLLAILISGATASLVATIAALRSPLLPALRSE